MEKILLRETTQRGGDPRWVQQAIEYAYVTVPKETGNVMDDPREVLGLLDGGMRLMNNSYQKDLLSILKSEKEDAATVFSTQGRAMQPMVAHQNSRQERVRDGEPKRGA